MEHLLNAIPATTERRDLSTAPIANVYLAAIRSVLPASVALTKFKLKQLDAISLIPIWIATLTVQQKSRMVRFQNAAQMQDFFRLSKDGRHYRRIVQGFQRVFAVTIFFWTSDQPHQNRLVDAVRFHFFDHIRLWFGDHEHHQITTEGCEKPSH